ncbi:Cas7 group CRISPR-associated protein Csh2 [Paraburkholderia sp. WC7.3g]|uniref:type I CRISPR-associated protein Cas7 n=1 Tax=Paraburkholderia sp. WC7.3g TaxID=2991070 RepID=UPI003D1DE797
MTKLRKIDFAVVFRIMHANPNGDRPRTDYSGGGEISYVCLKRILRDRWQETGRTIFSPADDRKPERQP